jgi:ABC-type uncharacterized transport system fused permease/ATPase subunit
MFVPRRPYAPTGRLREILRDGLGHDVPDDRMRAVLDEVGLGAAVAREGAHQDIGRSHGWSPRHLPAGRRLLRKPTRLAANATRAARPHAPG